MEAGRGTGDPIALEAAFRERRGRLLRANAVLLAAFALGLAGLLAAKALAPAWFEASIKLFVVTLLAALASAWWTARRHWSCPACDARWRSQDVLASLFWNHCAACGAALRALPGVREAERLARIDFEVAARSPDALRAEARRRRRRGGWLAALGVACGLAALAWLRAQALGEWAEQAVMALTGALAFAALAWSLRCPRCRGGLLARGHHCQRCGFVLDEPRRERGAPPAGAPSSRA